MRWEGKENFEGRCSLLMIDTPHFSNCHRFQPALQLNAPETRREDIARQAVRFCIAHHEDYASALNSDSMDVDSEFMNLCHLVYGKPVPKEKNWSPNTSSVHATLSQIHSLLLESLWFAQNESRRDPEQKQYWNARAAGISEATELLQNAIIFHYDSKTSWLRVLVIFILSLMVICVLTGLVMLFL